MCNPLEVTNVYRYNKEDIKRARKEHTKKRAKKMVKIEDPLNFHLESSLDQWVSENMPEGWLQQVRVLTAAEYESILENWLQRDDTLYLVQN